MKVRFHSLRYSSVNLSNEFGPKRLSLHRLILAAFIPMPRPGMLACHNDGDPTNSMLSNLRWDTPKGNNADKQRHGTWRGGVIVIQMSNYQKMRCAIFARDTAQESSRRFLQQSMDWRKHDPCGS